MCTPHTHERQIVPNAVLFERRGNGLFMPRPGVQDPPAIGFAPVEFPLEGTRPHTGPLANLANGVGETSPSSRLGHLHHT